MRLRGVLAIRVLRSLAGWLVLLLALVRVPLRPTLPQPHAHLNVTPRSLSAAASLQPRLVAEDLPDRSLQVEKCASVSLSV